MENRGQAYGAMYLALFFSVLLLLALNLCVGTVDIPLGEIAAILGGRGTDAVHGGVVLKLRLPRALAAAMLGGGLALSGYLLQAFFHNPIAGPFLLGVSSGAKLAVALVMVLFLGKSMAVSSSALIGAAFAGAMVSMGVVVLMSQVMDHMSTLIVSGVMVGYICSAITDFVVAFADDADIVNLHNWSKGSFSGIGWEDVAVMAVVIFAAFFCVLMLSKSMGAYGLGEVYARNMGLDVGRFRVALVALSSLLSACVTAFAGPVSFVGIAVPHLVKYLFRTTKPLVVVPACFLGGAAFCLLCDLLARVLLAPTELSISTVTAVFGAPVVILAMARRAKERG